VFEKGYFNLRRFTEMKKKLIIDIDEKLHNQFKSKTSEEGCSMKKIIEGFIYKYLGKKIPIDKGAKG
jgi:hypothetical protein